MTGPARDEIRDKLAAALFRVDIDHASGIAGMSYAATADALLPVVRQIAADELRAAAEDLANVPGNPYPLVVSEFLNGRADALEQS